jgi:transposase
MKPYSMDLRERVIRLVQEDELTQEEIAGLFGMSVRCVQMLVKQFRETGDIAPKKLGRPPGTGKIPMDQLQAFVSEHSDATLSEMRQGCGVSATLTGIWKALKRLRISRKKKVLHASEQDRPDVQAKRRQWRRKSRRLSAKHLIFIDETGISTRMHRDHGRAPVGERVIGAIPEMNYQSSTLMGSLRLNGQFESIVYTGGTDIPTVLTFIESTLAPTLKPGDIVVWDNLRAHRSPAVVHAIERTGASVYNLPPYSPDLNPIEQLWSKVKNLLCGVAARTQDALLEGLNKVIEHVTPQDIKHWFEHCGYAQSFS